MGDETRREEIRMRLAKLDVEWSDDWWIDHGWDGDVWAYLAEDACDETADPVNVLEEPSNPTAEFIAHARSDIPFLLDELSRAEAALQEAREALEWIASRHPDAAPGEHPACDRARAFLSDPEWEPQSTEEGR